MNQDKAIVVQGSQDSYNNSSNIGYLFSKSKTTCLSEKGPEFSVRALFRKNSNSDVFHGFFSLVVWTSGLALRLIQTSGIYQSGLLQGEEICPYRGSYVEPWNTWLNTEDWFQDGKFFSSYPTWTVSARKQEGNRRYVEGRYLRPKQTDYISRTMLTTTSYSKSSTWEGICSQAQCVRHHACCNWFPELTHSGGEGKVYPILSGTTDKKLNSDAKDALETIMIGQLGLDYGSLSWGTASKITHSAQCEAVVRIAADSKEFIVLRQGSNLSCIRWLAKQNMKSKRRPGCGSIVRGQIQLEHNHILQGHSADTNMRGSNAEKEKHSTRTGASNVAPEEQVLAQKHDQMHRTTSLLWNWGTNNATTMYIVPSEHGRQRECYP